MPFGKRILQPGTLGDRRAKPRNPLDAAAHILLPSGMAIACRVRDVSPSGARLLVDSILGLPTSFELRIKGQVFRAQVIRRSSRLLAVRFIDHS